MKEQNTAIEYISMALEIISKKINSDQYYILNEAELQSQLYLELTKLLNETVEVEVPNCVIFPDDFRHQEINTRIFREIRLDKNLGKKNIKPDLTIYKSSKLIALPKKNKAISSWKGEIELIIELKFNVSKNSSLKDLKKYDKEDSTPVIYINYKPNKTGITWEENYIELGGKGNIQAVAKTHNIDLRHVLRSINKVHKRYCKHPASMIREKDFESWISFELENIVDVNTCDIISDNKVIGSTTAIRNQITPLSFIKRRHDILIVDSLELPSKVGCRQNVLSTFAEVEIKTSHSNSHNWFDGRLNDEFDKMTEFNKRFKGVPIFVMFRLGSIIYLEDYLNAVKSYPQIRFLYLCSDGTAYDGLTRFNVHLL